MRDWRAIARVSNVGIPPAEVDAVAATLEGLERTLAPLIAKLSPAMEPATVFAEDAE